MAPGTTGLRRAPQGTRWIQFRRTKLLGLRPGTTGQPHAGNSNLRSLSYGATSFCRSSWSCASSPAIIASYSAILSSSVVTGTGSVEPPPQPTVASKAATQRHEQANFFMQFPSEVGIFGHTPFGWFFKVREFSIGVEITQDNGLRGRFGSFPRIRPRNTAFVRNLPTPSGA